MDAKTQDAANCETLAACSSCQTKCEVRVQKRELTSLTGPVALAETGADCPKCQRFFSLNGPPGEWGSRHERFLIG